eukprot:CAMPEP_0171740346 /NCGR_PEP_ID=MMETSP0991-20121206/34838_1 /TAXON_ID=483369 /ORGANISM="non described non described, Strain CCMP2098" /LENGTH=77 /DNA_ID=CAMNT_0012338265 /DNA_START=280 /DNA_END=514 /DNA_ORIENTATION=+
MRDVKDLPPRQRQTFGVALALRKKLDALLETATAAAAGFNERTACAPAAHPSRQQQRQQHQRTKQTSATATTTTTAP